VFLNGELRFSHDAPPRESWPSFVRHRFPDLTGDEAGPYCKPMRRADGRGKTVRRVFAWALLLTLVQSTTLAQYLLPETEGTSRLVGKVLDRDGKGIRGARVLAYHLSTERSFASEPTRGNGEYELENLPYGYFDLAVELSDGLYVSNRVVNVAPAGTTALIFTIVPDAPGSVAPPRAYVGSDRDVVGIADARPKAKGRDFWRGPKGVAVLAGLGGAALLAIVLGSDDETQASVF
jgi:hypothetical protein